MTEPTLPERPIPIAGACPMGCGRTLHAHPQTTGPWIIGCTHDGCPNPLAVSNILDNLETEHIVEFSPVGFAILHPLRERLPGVGTLTACDLHRACTNPGEHPVPLGRYRATPERAGRWTFSKVTA